MTDGNARGIPQPQFMIDLTEDAIAADSPLAIRWWNTGPVTVASGTWTPLTSSWGVEKSNGYEATSNGRFIAPSDGWYLAVASAEWAAAKSVVGDIVVGFLYNTTVSLRERQNINDSPGWGTTTAIVWMEKGHYLEMALYQTVYSPSNADFHHMRFAISSLNGLKGEQGETGMGVEALMEDLPHIQAKATSAGNSDASGTNWYTFAAGSVEFKSDDWPSPSLPSTDPIVIPEDGLYLIGASAGNYTNTQHTLYISKDSAGWQGAWHPGWVPASGTAMTYNTSSTPIYVTAGTKFGAIYWDAAVVQAMPDFTVYAIKLQGAKGDKGDTGSAYYNSGIVFPSSPSTNDEFFRTDLRGGMLFFWDGTYWLSRQLFTMDFDIGDLTATNAWAYRHGIDHEYDSLVTYVSFSLWCSSADASNWWQVGIDWFDTVTNIAYADKTTSGWTTPTATHQNSQLIAKTAHGFKVGATKYGSPGSFRAEIHMAYRLRAV